MRKQFKAMEGRAVQGDTWQKSDCLRKKVPRKEKKKQILGKSLPPKRRTRPAALAPRSSQSNQLSIKKKALEATESREETQKGLRRWSQARSPRNKETYIFLGRLAGSTKKGRILLKKVGREGDDRPRLSTFCTAVKR